MASKFIYWLADGGGKDVGDNRATTLHDWIVSQTNAELIVYGGDVYNSGKSTEFDEFGAQMKDDLARFCEPPGNHDWKTFKSSQAAGEIPIGYEEFWSTRPSKQPINAAKKGGARYEHVIDINGWRLIFLDTGICDVNPWPMGDNSRREWLRQQLLGGSGRAKIVFAHHSRVSCGKHGDNAGVDDLWRTLFDNNGAPLAALTVAGHDHNVNTYSPRPKEDPEKNPVDFAHGIHLHVNGAGGRALDAPWIGKKGDLFNSFDQYCVTQIELMNSQKANISVWGFGATPNPTDPPTKIAGGGLLISV